MMLLTLTKLVKRRVDATLFHLIIGYFGKTGKVKDALSYLQWTIK
jgi:hypothetical protein